MRGIDDYEPLYLSANLTSYRCLSTRSNKIITIRAMDKKWEGSGYWGVEGRDNNLETLP
jgi:hypothetical protein